MVINVSDWLRTLTKWLWLLLNDCLSFHVDAASRMVRFPLKHLDFNSIGDMMNHEPVLADSWNKHFSLFGYNWCQNNDNFSETRCLTWKKTQQPQAQSQIFVFVELKSVRTEVNWVKALCLCNFTKPSVPESYCK